MIYVVFSICFVNIIISTILLCEHFQNKKSNKYYFSHGYKAGYEDGYERGHKRGVLDERLRALDEEYERLTKEIKK